MTMTTGTTGTRRATGQTLRDRRTWLDLGLLGALLLVTLAGLSPSFQGWTFLLVGTRAG
jgi:hypothetical protein